MRHIQTWLAFIIVLISVPAFADNTQITKDPFQDIVAKYQAANPKPKLSEEARKFKVQAEFEVQQKQFVTAAEFYGKALEIAPWWPEGHFNRAIILGETKQYQDAMIEMKHYLLLVPDAPDARAAQDKIYEWDVGATAAKEAATKAIKQLSCESTGIPTRKWNFSFNFANHTVTNNQHTYSFDGFWGNFLTWQDAEDGLVRLLPNGPPGEYGGMIGADTFWSQRNVLCKP
jgi:tetratricopeptide (TPR) repeat protein